MYFREWWQAMFGRKGDWFPFAIGVLLLIISVPTFTVLLVWPDADWEAVMISLLVLFGAGTALGIFFTIMGLRQCDGLRFGLLRFARRDSGQDQDDMPPAVRRFLDS